MIVRLEGSTFIFQNILNIMGLEDTQGVGFFNRFKALADVELSVNVMNV